MGILHAFDLVIMRAMVKIQTLKKKPNSATGVTVEKASSLLTFKKKKKVNQAYWQLKAKTMIKMNGYCTR